MSTNKDLDNVLSSLTQYRDALVTNLQQKGAEISSDATLYQGLHVVESIQNLQPQVDQCLARVLEILGISVPSDSQSASISASSTLPIPSDSSLIFYAPLNTLAQTAQTGQTLTYTGSPLIESVNGISAMKFDSSTLLDTRISNSVYGSDVVSSDLTFSFWLKRQTSQDGVATFVTYAPDSGGYYYATRFIVFSNNTLYVQNYGTVSDTTVATDMTHIVLVFTSNRMLVYYNGTYVAQLQTSESGYGIRSGLTLHSNDYHSPQSVLIHMAAFRIYSRVLSSDQIYALSKEFTPATDPTLAWRSLGI